VLCDVFKDLFTVNNAVLKDLDLTGVEQLTDMFFIMIQFLHRDSSFCRSLNNLSLAGCTHITDLSIIYITSLFPNLKQASLQYFYSSDVIWLKSSSYLSVICTRIQEYIQYYNESELSLSFLMLLF